MKQLLVLRHAKSRWDDPGLADFDRPLGPRGLKTAPLMGRELVRRDWLPDLAQVSPALRTRETWRLASAELPARVPVEFAEALFEATAADVLAEVRKTIASAGCLLVLGHNPGLEDLARRLAGPRSDAGARRKLEEKFPTGALARFVIDDEWADLAFGTARLTHCIGPKDLV